MCACARTRWLGLWAYIDGRPITVGAEGAIDHRIASECNVVAGTALPPVGVKADADACCITQPIRDGPASNSM